jgi:hypothetical protein
MNRFIYILIASFIVSGCASTVKSTRSNDTLARFEKNYKDCLTRMGGDATQCTKEKDQLERERNRDDFPDEIDRYGS